MYLLASIPLTVVVVALEQASYTVTEGNTVAACVEIISSASSLECDIVATLTTVNGTAGEHPFAVFYYLANGLAYGYYLTVPHSYNIHLPFSTISWPCRFGMFFFRQA